MKRTLKAIALLAIGASCALLAGCANVKAYERGNLSQPEMQFDADFSATKLSQQMYAAKEAASGGYTTGGGGCGCN
jgi:hypothetical protein